MTAFPNLTALEALVEWAKDADKPLGRLLDMADVRDLGHRADTELREMQRRLKPSPGPFDPFDLGLGDE